MGIGPEELVDYVFVCGCSLGHAGHIEHLYNRPIESSEITLWNLN
jgi:hypothetical protein